MTIRVIIERKNRKLSDKVFAKAAKIEKEGKPKDQSIAIAASMDERGELEETGRLDSPGGLHTAPGVGKRDDDEESLDEMNAMGVGGIQGGGAPFGKRDDIKKFNKDEEERSHLDGDSPLEEMYSTSGHFSSGVGPRGIDEFAGFAERSDMQGLKNVPRPKRKIKMRISKYLRENDESTFNLSDSDLEALAGAWEDDDTAPRVGRDDSSKGPSTFMKLTDFVDIPRNVERMLNVYDDVSQNIGRQKMLKAVLNDKTAQSRINIMENNFGFDQGTWEAIEQDDDTALRNYYQFVINEFLYYIAYNPKASARMYSGRDLGLTEPTQDLAFTMVSRYVSRPNEYNPSAMSAQMGREAEEYKLEKDLDSALYDLPE